MSTAVFNAGTEIVPSRISYSEERSPKQQNSNWYWSILCAPVEKLGTVLRNSFYLPQYKQSHDLDIDYSLAKEDSDKLARAEHFSVRDVEVRLDDVIPLIFTVRLFESKKPVNNKKLQLILFSFYGNHEEHSGKPVRWEPLSVNELSKSPLLVLKAFQSKGVRVDSLITTSLGNVVLDSLKDISTKSSAEAVPSTVVINRGLTSVNKVAGQLFSFPFNSLLHGAAKLTGYDADPEQGLLTFLHNHQNSNNPPRQVVMIECQKDNYFSGSSGFESNYHDKLTNLGARVFRASFYPFPFQVRAHHALSLAHLTNNLATKKLSDTANFSPRDGESASSMLARNVFLAGDKDVHICFYVGGNDANLDLATARDVIPLLEDFVKEGRKMESNLHDSEMAS